MSAVYARRMTQRSLWLCAILLNLGLTIVAGCQMGARDEVAAASAVPLVGTNWRLTQLEGQIVENPSGASAISLQLQPQNPRATGFAGCNRLFGGYLLEGDRLRFDQLGATKMACVDDNRMKLEQRYFDVLARVASWRITDRSLALFGASGNTLAEYSAETASP
jgi:heat shock protein HslJ